MRVGDLVKVKDEGPLTRYTLKDYKTKVGMIIRTNHQKRFNRFYVLVDGIVILAWEIDLELA